MNSPPPPCALCGRRECDVLAAWHALAASKTWPESVPEATEIHDEAVRECLAAVAARKEAA